MKSIGEISVSDAQRAGFREFSSCENGKQRSRRSLNKVARRGGGTDCAPPLAHRLVHPLLLGGAVGFHSATKTWADIS